MAILDLAPYLRRFGHTVDCYYLDQLSAEHFTNRSYDVVGLSVLQALKENVPVKDAIFLKKKFATKVVVGGKWTQTMREEEKASFSKHGIQVWTGPGERYFIDREIDFDNYPSWDRKDFQTLDDVRPDIMSSRGCPYRCHFCHNTERKLLFFSSKRTADNIELLFGLGIARICFCDDIFTFKTAHMETLYTELKRRNIPIEDRAEFFTHVNQINPDIIDWIKRYRPFHINLGIESGDDDMLRLMNKGFDSETAFNKLKVLHDETGLTIGTLFIIGFPGESEESLKKTLLFVRRIRPYAGSWVSSYQPVRGTKGYEMALSRAGTIKAGRRNNYITYVDPSLTKRLLFKYHYMLMDFAPANSFRSRLIRSLIEILPCSLLMTLRQTRQNRRVRNWMESYLVTEGQ